ncbi:MAG: 50S ribosomal protein L17 [Betaproteobacteria bacterium]
MKKNKLGRRSGARKAVFRNLVTSLVLKGRVVTTEGKAPAVRALTDKMITLGKRGDLHARRQAAAYLLDPEAVQKLFETIAPRYATRAGGYTREIKAGYRRGDAAPTVVIEFV